MDSKQFYQRLSELAEWEISKPTTNAHIRTDRDHVEEIWEYDPDLDEDVLVSLSMDRNETLPVKIKSLKLPERPCEDCGLTVCGRTIQIKHYDYPKPHWRRYCENCKFIQNPETGKYDLKFWEIQDFYVKYFRRNK